MTTVNERLPDLPSPTNRGSAAGAPKVHAVDSPYPGRALRANDSIRLVEIFPGNDDEPICCALSNARLEDGTTPEYEALSYSWGDPTAKHEIQVNNSTDPLVEEKTSFLVPTNCFSALRRLRRPRQHGTVDKNPIFWIDSICIDQNCIPERNHQLSLMYSIYSKASRVVIDLGSERDQSADVMDWIADVHAPSDHEAQTVKPSPETIQKLFARPWFRRVWVLQEALLACEVDVMCGDRKVSWEAFKTFKNNDQGQTVHPVPFVLRESASKYAKNTDKDEEKMSRTLFNCLRESRGCEATDPRDQVYALLPLLMGDFSTQGKQQSLLKPDYSLTTAQVYTDLAYNFLRTSGIGLGVIRAVFPGSNLPGLPSWVPDWSMKPCFSYMLYEHHSIVDEISFYYFLDQESDPSQQIWHVDSTMGGLFVSIAFLGSITHLTSPAIISSNEFPLSQWKMALPQWSLARSDDASQPRRLIVNPDLRDFALNKALMRCELSPFSRTLLGDRIIYPHVHQEAESLVISFEHEHPRASRMDAITRPSQGKIYRKEARRNRREVELRDHEGGSGQETLPGIFRSLPYGSYRNAGILILDCCDGRRMAVIGGEWLALVPIETRENDWIGFICGIKVPMVMRYAEDNSQYDGYRKARLVGECFVLDVAGEGAVTRSTTNGFEKIVII